MVKDLRQPETEEVLLSTAANKFPTDWSLDERLVLYETLDSRTQRDLWVLPLSGDRRPRPLLQSEFNEEQGQLSPDGRWLAYISDETGRWEVYVRSFPGLGDLRHISTAGGTHPRWRRDGKEIFYLSRNHTLMAVDLRNGIDAELPAPQSLFPISINPSVVPLNERTLYSVTADGQRFLVASPLDGAGPQAVTVVTNWPSLIPRGR
jgi:Tol biopolymer transport system component